MAPSLAHSHHQPLDPNDEQLERLTMISERLSDAIAADIAALEDGNFAALHTSDPEIEKLSAQYGREVQSLKASGNLKAASPPAREALKSAQTRLKTLLGRHEKMLSAMRHVSEGMVQAVAEEISKMRAQSTPYAPRPQAKPASSGAIIYNKVV